MNDFTAISLGSENRSFGLQTHKQTLAALKRKPKSQHEARRPIDSTSMQVTVTYLQLSNIHMVIQN